MESDLEFDENLHNDLQDLLNLIINDERINIGMIFKAQNVKDKLNSGLIQSFRQLDEYEIADRETNADAHRSLT